VELYTELKDTVLAGETERLKDLIKTLLAEHRDPLEIISEGLMAAMSTLGQKWKSGEVFIPEVLRSANTVIEGMDLLKPLLMGHNVSDFYVGKVVIGTVQGDIHNIGKSLVSLVLQSGGFQVIDIGINVPAAKFLEIVHKERPHILGLSALLTMTMPRMQEVIQALKENDLRDSVLVMVGGAPVTIEFANSIGADGYAPDAILALSKAKKLLSRRQAGKIIA